MSRTLNTGLNKLDPRTPNRERALFSSYTLGPSTPFLQSLNKAKKRLSKKNPRTLNPLRLCVGSFFLEEEGNPHKRKEKMGYTYKQEKCQFLTDW